MKKSGTASIIEGKQHSNRGPWGKTTKGPSLALQTAFALLCFLGKAGIVWGQLMSMQDRVYMDSSDIFQISDSFSVTCWASLRRSKPLEVECLSFFWLARICIINLSWKREHWFNLSSILRSNLCHVLPSHYTAYSLPTFRNHPKPAYLVHKALNTPVPQSFKLTY